MSNQIQKVRTDLDRMADQFQAVLPSHISPQRFQRTAVTAIQNTPALLNADRRSLYGAFMKAAQDGLLPDGREGSIVLFGKQAQWMPMVAGILKKVRNSGDLESLSSETVHQGDEFDYWIDEDGPHLRHRPNFMGDRGPMKLVYAVAKVKGGGVYVEVMSEEQITKVRAVSRSAEKGPWKDWPDEMAKKTVIRRLAKRLPMSTDLESVITSVDEQYQLKEVPAQEVRRGIAAIHAATQAQDEAEDAQIVEDEPDGPIPGLDPEDEA